MATIAKPRKRAFVSRRVLIWSGVILALVLICAVAGMFISSNMSSAAQLAAASGWKTETVQKGAIDALVSATGNIEPRAKAELHFDVEGTVTQILVKAGEKVVAGQPLARIDDTDLKLKLEQAQTDLQQAQASLAEVTDGATSAEIAESKARVAQAQAQYNQTAGSVTQADIAAARAKLEAAKSQLAALNAGHTDMSDAELSLQQSQTQLSSKRDQLSADKTNAQINMQQSANDLTKAQSSYALAKKNWDYVQDTGRDPLTATTDSTSGKSSHPKLTDQQRQQYYDTYVQAEATLRNAEATLKQAQIDYDNARQAEVTGVQSAEQDVTSAQSKLDSLKAGGNSEQMATARANVSSAQAELDRLVGSNRAGDLASAKAGVDIAQQQLAGLLADPAASSLAKAEASVASAEVSVKQAQINLDRATLKAPFAATIARIDLRVGEASSGATSTSDSTSVSSITIADLNSFYIDVPVDELDVAQVTEGCTVRIALDALPDTELTGKVTNVEPLATQNDKGTNTYKVTVDIDSTTAVLRSGMTATAQIVTQSKSDVVLIPRRAVLSDGDGNYVLIPKAGPADVQNQRPASERRAVTLGLSNGESIEVLSGLESGEQVLVQDVVQTFNPVGQGR